jgi:hypothetical protein
MCPSRSERLASKPPAEEIGHGLRAGPDGAHRLLQFAAPDAKLLQPVRDLEIFAHGDAGSIAQSGAAFVCWHSGVPFLNLFQVAGAMCGLDAHGNTVAARIGDS